MRNPQTEAFYNAQTLAMAGCGGPKCLTGKPTELCRSCNLRLIAMLAYAADPHPVPPEKRF